jgi:GDP-L-fucose synthase
MSFWKEKRVLVTGGARFIGSYLVKLLAEQQPDVHVADNLERGRLENLQSRWDDITFIQGDLRDPAICREVTANQDVVMNLAAKVTGIEYNRYHHGDMFTSNILINTNVLEAARLNGVKRYLTVSTACIYPLDVKVPTPESEGGLGWPEPTNEGYGWAKRMAEQ